MEFSINACNLDHYYPKVFDTVFFTFPYAFEDRFSLQHENLISNFLRSASHVTRPGGDIRIALQSDQLVRWYVVMHARANGVELIHCGGPKHSQPQVPGCGPCDCHYFNGPKGYKSAKATFVTTANKAWKPVGAGMYVFRQREQQM